MTGGEKEFKFYPEDVLRKLDFETIKNELTEMCYGTLGRERINSQELYTDKELLKSAISRISEFREIIKHEPYFPERWFDRLPFLENIKIEGFVLNTDEFVRLFRLLQTFSSVIRFLSKDKREEVYPELYLLIQGVYWDQNLLGEIDRVVDSENETVRATASESLTLIRKKIQKAERHQQTEFAKALKKYRQTDFLAEQGEGVRGGRRVLAVKSEFKRNVPGIYHDDSAGGTIAFIEPQETVIWNNEVQTQHREEAREIRCLLKELTEYVRPHLKSFYVYQDILAQFDAVRAKAILAGKLKSSAPEISADGELQLFHFRHPILYLNYQKQGREVVENTLILSKDEKILMVSGPNAGGKSVVLKSAGLLQLMFQFGMHIPVGEGSKLPVFEQLFADIGDAQSVENDLSTYSSHLKNMKHFTEKSDSRTLVLLDELGHGTDPILGGAMAEAVMDSLLQKGVYAIVTTHYANLKAWGTRTKGVQNGAMSFDRKHLEPLYQLNTGSPGSSFTFEIATKSGLNTQIISNAKTKIGEQNQEMEMSLTEIQHEKQYIRGLRKSIQQREKQLSDLQETYEQLKRNFEKEKKNLLRQVKSKVLDELQESNRELEVLMKAWQEDKKNKEKFIRVKKFIDQKKDDISNVEILTTEADLAIHVPEETIGVGSKVRLIDGTAVGEITEIRKNKAIVNFGNLTSLISLNRLEAVKNYKTPRHTSTLQAAKRLSERASFNTELDLRGKMKDEGLVILEEFLDKAVMYGFDGLRIIHGRGTGAIRQMVHAVLKKHIHVKNFEFESAEFGGDGVTLVMLK